MAMFECVWVRMCEHECKYVNIRVCVFGYVSICLRACEGVYVIMTENMFV